jgi:hypothetical protein
MFANTQMMGLDLSLKTVDSSLLRTKSLIRQVSMTRKIPGDQMKILNELLVVVEGLSAATHQVCSVLDNSFSRK